MPGSGPRRRGASARLLTALTVLALLATACTQVPEEARPTPGPTLTAPSFLRVGIGQVATLDPAALDGPEEVFVAAQLFDGLVGYDAASGAVVPAVAEAWDVSEKGKRFIFRLRESSFHDGSPVGAEDFVRGWTRLVDPQEQHPFAFLLESVQGFSRHRLSFGARPFSGVRAVDDSTLEVRLTVPSPDFVSVLGHPSLSPVPPSADDPGFPVRPVGNGPFRLTEDIGLDSPISLEAFEESLTPPRVSALELRPLATPDAGWPDFLSGELDVAPIPGSLIEQVIRESGDRGVRPLGRLVYCGFNLEQRRFRERGLREAVSVALDRERLVGGVYGSLAAPADGVVPPSFPGHRPDACGDRCDLDVERARSLVAELPSRSRVFPLDFAASDVGEQLAGAVSEQLAEVGLSVEPRGHDADAYATLLQRGEQGFFCLTWVGDFPRQRAMLEPLFLADSPDNQTGVSDERLEDLLERARAEPNPVDREELYVAAERRALEVMPIVPIAWFQSRFAVQPWVEGFAVDALGMFDAATLSLRP